MSGFVFKSKSTTLAGFYPSGMQLLVTSATVNEQGIQDMIRGHKATLYMAGSFNSWNPGSPAHALTKNPDGSYEITLPANAGAVQFKFTRGAWASVETDAQNQDIGNRICNLNAVFCRFGGNIFTI